MNYDDKILTKKVYYNDLLNEKIIVFFDKDNQIVHIEKNKSYMFLFIAFLATIALLSAIYILAPLVTKTFNF